MTRRTRALLLGLAVAGAYITGAAATARLSILGRAPLLDGFTAPPPYRWVSPPPALASKNVKPASGRFTINIDPQSGSEANVWTTHDAQVSVALGQGAIPPSGHADAILRITPLAPDPAARLPAGLTLAGNVYRIQVTYVSGQIVTSFTQPGQIALAYPASPDALSYRHTMLRSTDGRTWTNIRGADSVSQQVVQASMPGPGYFAVGQSRRGTPLKKKSPTRLIVEIIEIAAVILVIGFAVVVEIRHRRARARDRTGRGGRRARRR